MTFDKVRKNGNTQRSTDKDCETQRIEICEEEILPLQTGDVPSS